jgi:DNA-binding MarR family transcriptional regulator
MPPTRRKPAPEAAPLLTAKRLVTFDDAVPPVHRIPIAVARRFLQICITAAAESLEGHDLTPQEWGVIRYLNRFNGEPDIDQNGLAARMGIDRNSVSLLVDRLDKEGLVERRVNGDDRRARLLRLTPKGERLHAKILPKTFAGQQDILDVLKPAEREVLFDLLIRVIEGNRTRARPGAGRRKRGSAKPSANDKSSTQKASFP